MKFSYYLYHFLLCELFSNFVRSLDERDFVRKDRDDNHVDKPTFLNDFAAEEDEGPSTRYMVKYASPQVMNRSSRISLMSIDSLGIQVVDIRSKDELKEIEDDDNVLYVEPDRKRFFMDAIPHKKLETGDWTPYGINMVKALRVSDDFVENRKVCIIDSGYYIQHEDLPKPPYVSGHTGYNWEVDGCGHGTHVAGTIAAVGGNGKGVLGVNRSGKLRLHIVKVFGERGGCSWSWASTLIAAAQECVNVGSNIINMSLGGGRYSSIERDAWEDILTNHNVLPIAAAGNQGTTRSFYPASYPAVMSVGAIDDKRRVAYFSQRNDQVEICAPGVEVLSTRTGQGYVFYSGTSMAAPHVAGVAALIWSHDTNITAGKLRSILIQTADDLGVPGRDNDYGHGLVRADKAYEFVDSNYTLPPTNSPTDRPSTEPTLSQAPTITASTVPSTTPTLSTFPTLSDAPTVTLSTMPSMTSSSSPTEFAQTCQESEFAVHVRIKIADAIARQIIWNVTDDGLSYANGGPYDYSYDYPQYYTESICLDADLCYKFKMWYLLGNYGWGLRDSDFNVTVDGLVEVNKANCIHANCDPGHGPARPMLVHERIGNCVPTTVPTSSPSSSPTELECQESMEHVVNVTILAGDIYALQVYWNLTNEDLLYAEGGPYEYISYPRSYTKSLCLDADLCYKFKMWYPLHYGTGLRDGDFNVKVDGVVELDKTDCIDANCYPASGQSNQLLVHGRIGNCVPTTAPTIAPTASSPPTLSDFPTSRPSSSPTEFAQTCQDSEHAVHVRIKVADSISRQIIWNVTSDGLSYANGGPYYSKKYPQYYTESICLDADLCYKFKMWYLLGNYLWGLRDSDFNVTVDGQVEVSKANCIHSNCDPGNGPARPMLVYERFGNCVPTTVPTSSSPTQPTKFPSSSPTSQPTSNPTASPTSNPSSTPSSSPTTTPTSIPTISPTLSSTGTSTPDCTDRTDFDCSKLKKRKCDKVDWKTGRIPRLMCPEKCESCDDDDKCKDVKKRFTIGNEDKKYKTVFYLDHKKGGFTTRKRFTSCKRINKKKHCDQRAFKKKSDKKANYFVVDQLCREKCGFCDK